MGKASKRKKEKIAAANKNAQRAHTIFLPTFQNDFTNWDDDMYIRDNPLVKSLSADNLEQMFMPDEKAFVGGNYHPLTILTLAINYRISGLNPWSYQLFNILLHLLNTFLVFLLLYRLCGNKSDIALIAALLFGIHPMHVESVSWVAERKDVLYTAFYLAGLLQYSLRVIKTGCCCFSGSSLSFRLFGETRYQTPYFS